MADVDDDVLGADKFVFVVGRTQIERSGFLSASRFHHAKLLLVILSRKTDVVDAWVRMAETGVKLDPSVPSLLDVLDATPLDGLARVRPDLIKRARNALIELGQFDEINWPQL